MSKQETKEEVDAAFAAQASNADIRAEMLGHNSKLQISPELQEDFKMLHKLASDRKAINASINGIFGKIKERFGLPKAVTRREFALQCKAIETRLQEEQGAKDIKAMLGIQMSLDLVEAEEAEEVEANSAEAGDPIEAAKAEKKKLKAV